jgi:hypothetical protein
MIPGITGYRSYHLHQSQVQKAIKQQIEKAVLINEPWLISSVIAKPVITRSLTFQNNSQPNKNDADGFGKPVRLRVILESAKPVIRAATVRSNNQDLHIGTYLPVKYIVRKTGDSITPDIGRKLDFIAVRGNTNLEHGCVKGSKITRTKA